MTQRRRFFAATPVQQLPGVRVDLGARLQPASGSTGQASAAPSAGSVVGVALFPAWIERYHYAEQGTYPVPWVEVPTFEDWRLTRCYVNILEGGETLFDAVVIGQSADAVTWTWNLNVPPMPPYSVDGTVEPEGPVSWAGAEIEQRDASLRIRIKTGELPYNGVWWAQLTCTASVGATVVGQIILRPGFHIGLYQPPIV